jgi:hypothetical protein
VGPGDGLDVLKKRNSLAPPGNLTADLRVLATIPAELSRLPLSIGILDNSYRNSLQNMHKLLTKKMLMKKM